MSDIMESEGQVIVTALTKQDLATEAESWSARAQGLQIADAESCKNAGLLLRSIKGLRTDLANWFAPLVEAASETKRAVMRAILTWLGDRWQGCWWEHDGEPEASETELYLRCTRCGLRSGGVRRAPPPRPIRPPDHDEWLHAQPHTRTM